MKQREVKFRAYNKRLKRMLQVHDIYFKQNLVRCHNALAKKGDSEYGLYFEWLLVDKSLVIQKNGPAKSTNKVVTILLEYTGLKDKNGKEIYEGDIVHVLISDPEFPTLVYWYRGAFFIINRHGITCTLGNFGEDQVEIIGNIYENPELCKSNQET